MKILIAVSILGLVSADGPWDNLENLQRAKAAPYETPYGPPCTCGRQPITLYLAPQPSPRPMYLGRNLEGPARSYYDSGVGSASSGSASTSTSSGSTVIGLFPDTKNCALPLLLNCAPNVVKGVIKKPITPYPAYRTAEDEHSLQSKDGNVSKVLRETQGAADKLEDK